MKSFVPGFLERQPITQNVLQTVRRIAEYKGKHALLPWWEYFLGVMLLGTYREFEDRVGLVTSRRGSKTELALDTIRRFTGDFTIRDVKERCPTVGVDLLRRILREERNAGRLKCLGRGPMAKWRNK
jgi:hypothetical protein